MSQLLVVTMVIFQAFTLRRKASVLCCRGASKAKVRPKQPLLVQDHAGGAPQNARVRVTYLAEGDVYYSVIPVAGAAEKPKQESLVVEDVENDMYASQS